MNRVRNKQVAIRALGTMSGTSLDGVDAAVLETDGTRIVSFGPSAFRPYSHAERAVIRRAFGQWEGPDVAAAAETVEMAHAAVLGGFDLPELVGFHGQTLSHAPEAGQSLQVGDGALLAEALGAPVVWDFRSADMVLGGQGAPLAPFYHHACARWIGAQAPIAFLNLGGVGNLTWVDPMIAEPDEPGALLAFDTGPANAPINDLMLARRGQPQDRGGALAATGDVEEAALEAFLADPYFARIPPKSLDRNAFSEIVKVAEALNDADAVATLTAMAAVAVAQGLDHCPSPPAEILVAGGGRHNPVLMEMIAAGVPCPVRPVEEVGLDGDMLEAQAFAYLAVRVARGLPTSCPSTTGVRASISGGTLSWPGA